MGANSACDCSGEADDEPALRSRSSRRFFIFLPVHLSARMFELDHDHARMAELTVIALSYPVLYSSTFSQV